MHVKVSAEVQSGTGDGKAAHKGSARPLQWEEGLQGRFGNLLQTHAVSPQYPRISQPQIRPTAGGRYLGKKIPESFKEQCLICRALSATLNPHK